MATPKSKASISLNLVMQLFSSITISFSACRAFIARKTTDKKLEIEFEIQICPEARWAVREGEIERGRNRRRGREEEKHFGRSARTACKQTVVMYSQTNFSNTASPILD